MVDIGALTGGTGGVAKAASFDGSVIVGFSFIPGGSGNRAFRWTASEMLNLGNLPGGLHSDALDVTADGATVVGVAGNQAAFIWTAADGMRDLNVLYDALIPAGWRLERAESISPNGRSSPAAAEIRTTARKAASCCCRSRAT